MSKMTPTPFWLEVKKNYVVENFDSMVEYLYNYSAHPDSPEVLNDPKSDFGRTFSALKELVYDDYMAQHHSDCVYTFEQGEWADISFQLRAMCTYLLAAKIKNECDHKVLTMVADILLLNRAASTAESREGIKKVIMGCMTKSEIDSYGFAWRDIREWDKQSDEIICNKIGNTSFLAPASGMYAHEGMGTIVLGNDGKLQMLPMNIANRLNPRAQFSSQFTINETITFDVPRSDYQARVEDFEKLRDIWSGINRTQPSIVPAPVAAKRHYSIDDVFVAKVTGYSEAGVTAESVDENYEKVRGKVFVGNVYGYLDEADFKKHIKIDNYILVGLNNVNDVPMKLSTGFEQFYKDYAQSVDWETCGVFLRNYNSGYSWLTEHGIQANVMGKELCDNVREAIETHQAVALDIIGTSIDRSGHPVVNAKYAEEEIGEDAPCGGDFVALAKKTIFGAFVEYAKERVPENKPRAQYFRIDDLCVKALSHYLFFLAGSLPNSRDRYVHIAAARFLANIDANSLDADYMTIELRYQHCLARFATDKEDPQALKFEVCDQYKELDSVKRHIQTIDCLKTYKKNCSTTMSQFELQNLDDEERADMIESLIDSSNTLNGKISQPEINRIKKQITKLLGVDDLFVNTIPDITYYGEESDTLEFKSSAVYPPDNGGKPEPNRQLWTILKTICGFLNTLSGGELLLGVKDNGNSCGLADDLDYLYKNNKISECSMDKYRNYIKNAADAAFVDDMKIASEKEITTGRVNYFIEKNKEGHDILRIQIRPYEYGVVLFNSNRPEYVSDGYVRTSGATMSLTTEIKADIAKRKLNVAYDGNQRKLCLLRQACKNRKQVRLVNYSSGSGVRDRIVEPYLLVPLHKEFICYEAAAAGSHIRSFKISRMADVEVLNENWKYTSKHKHLKVDVFGMLEDVVNPPFEVKLKLDTLAYNLLLEEQPLAKNYVSENSDESDREQFPWLLCTSICKPEGVGRFYIGLSEHVKLEYGERLKTYVREKAKRLAAL